MYISAMHAYVLPFAFLDPYLRIWITKSDCQVRSRLMAKSWSSLNSESKKGKYWKFEGRFLLPFCSRRPPIFGSHYPNTPSSRTPHILARPIFQNSPRAILDLLLVWILSQKIHSFPTYLAMHTPVKMENNIFDMTIFRSFFSVHPLKSKHIFVILGS